MAGKGGGAWKVAYADFVTAMMAFFMVMWLVGQGKEVKEAVAGYFRDPFGTEGRPAGMGIAPGGDGFATGKGVKPRIATDGKKSGGKRIVAGGAAGDDQGLGIGGTIRFSGNSVELDAEAREHLDRLIESLVGKQNKIEIRGHTASGPDDGLGEASDAWRVSYERAMTVLKYLVEHGLDAKRLRVSQVGPYEPKVASDTPGWQAINSRVEVLMLGEFVQDHTAQTPQTIRSRVRSEKPTDEPATDGHGAADHADGHGGGPKSGH